MLQIIVLSVLAIAAGVPAAVFWARVFSRVIHSPRNRERARIFVYWLEALPRVKSARGALTIARQRDWEETIGLGF